METQFSTTKLIVVGTCVLVFTLGGFLYWAMTVSLSSASVAPGNLVVESKRKQIQHLQGGWVKQVFVKEGELVSQGQLLAELSDTKAEADYQRYRYRGYSLMAKKARLTAIIEHQNNVQWPSELTREDIELATVTPILNGELVQFEQTRLRKQLIDSRYEQQVALYTEKAQGSEFQRKAIATQRELVRQEIMMTQGLVAKGYVSKTRMLELKRHHARVDAELAEINMSIEVTKRELITLSQTHQTQLLDMEREFSLELSNINNELRDIQQLMRAAQDVRARIQIRSEFEGRVVGLNISSLGGVVRPGQVLMEIVPNSDELIVEAIVSPKDIDIVRPGQQARVRLTAYSARKTPPVLGEVIHVSADRVIQGGEASNSDQGYLVTVRFNRQNLLDIQREQGIELYPGMITEVLILVEERTLWDYLVSPLFSGVSRAMREV
ncbi:HlyD family type I secretion periplasmic adaptor subunit [Vibrio sinensis]|uniref:Membrane fusion protein (MFP) family protein n=1 Tax=Vibrio sinensis TaxID=2302434 RepID=A0A3A6QSU0_9VIBR|nr:HlyD family type I secretion periplasmic adaptor subunit [Vibrio sinensis]RJX71406.1 HlyD family type I secretion periplasmic adaptor subunit [Vibrio sinensis]